MKRFSVIALLCVWCYVLVAQVTSNPAPIPAGYKEKVVLTFDPTKGNGGMATATECYSHIGLITDKSKDIHDWKYIKPGGWGTKNEPKWDKNGANWELQIDNMFTYFGCPESEAITAIVMVFHDGNGNNSKEGKASNGGDIMVGVGEEIPADIWDNYNPEAVQKQARPSGVVNGIYYGADGTSVTLCTYAATKTNEPAKHVFVVGDMTDWKIKNEYQLKQDGNYFWITITGLTKGKEYRFQYAIERADGVKKQISDLFSEKVLTPDDGGEPSKHDPNLIGYPLYGADGYVTVIQPGKAEYNWSSATTNFKRPNKNNLLIYEMWVYDHTPNRGFEGLMERLDYLENLGVNAIELMPVNEFDGNYSWGYCPNHYFALEKAYGTPNQLKAFIDECHKRGMAVILDMVFNHATGNNPMNKLYPYGTDLAKNPWFNVTAPHSDNVFEDWNHGFGPTKDHFTRVLQYWLKEYRIDGYRMDLSHGLCSDKANTSVENLKYYYENGIKKSVSPDAYFILEHWGSNMATERPQLVNAGMMCWENTCTSFQQITMGWLKDGDQLYEANKDNYVAYCENHDEERCFFKAKQWGDGNLKGDESARAGRIPAVIGFQCMLDGPQLFYHFAEIGFDFSKFQKWDGKTWGKDGVSEYGKETATPSVDEEAKMQVKARPEQLGWFKAGARMKAYQRLAKILQLRTKLMPSVFEGNPTGSQLDSGKPVRTVQWGSSVFVAANFSATASQQVTLPGGTWYDYLDGNGTASGNVSLNPGQIKVYTGSKQTAPTIPSGYDFEESIEQVEWNSTFTSPEATKFYYEGQIYILREGVIYDMMGRKVQ